MRRLEGAGLVKDSFLYQSLINVRIIERTTIMTIAVIILMFATWTTYVKKLFAKN